MTQISLKEKYEKEIKPLLFKKLEKTNIMSVPRVTKIVVNMGTQDSLKDQQLQNRLITDFAAITGQKPKIQQARLSIAGFGVREGNPVGLTVTLRGTRMYAFLDKLINVVLPRLRDFRGVPLKSFDKHGNYTVGLPEYSLFPEIDITKVPKKQGLEITIVTNTKDSEESFKLLSLLGLPFEKQN